MQACTKRATSALTRRFIVQRQLTGPCTCMHQLWHQQLASAGPETYKQQRPASVTHGYAPDLAPCLCPRKGGGAWKFAEAPTGRSGASSHRPPHTHSHSRSPAEQATQPCEGSSNLTLCCWRARSLALPRSPALNPTTTTPRHRHHTPGWPTARKWVQEEGALTMNTAFWQ